MVDNGSSRPVDPALVDAFEGRLRVERIDPAPPSPAHAANIGLGLAEGDLVGLDRRRGPPGLAWAAGRRAPGRPPGRPTADHGPRVPPGRGPPHAGRRSRLRPGRGGRAARRHPGGRTTATGSSRSARRRGRRVAGCSARWARAAACSARRRCGRSSGGLDERFALPGGGLVNHDLYRRACALAGVELIVLLGEGTFHQYHGGAATSRRHSWDEMHDDYQAIRGEPHRAARQRAALRGHGGAGGAAFHRALGSPGHRPDRRRTATVTRATTATMPGPGREAAGRSPA